ncbi:MAG: 3-deoxy-D-manno-octulosonic acid transferase [Alphaproteobacteria bacterium]|nr:MAG: 3-deoxy-D-manno-octulosonic acid transferase [Alphaproteobacteria bacterium]
MAAVPEGVPLALQIYRLLSRGLAPLAPVLLSHRLKQGKEHPERLNERYGQSEIPRPSGALAWVHCASVGELLTVIPLIGCIRDKGLAVLCTSGTVTSANIAELRLPAGTIHQFITLDTPRFVNRFLDHWRPDLALFVESDLWPNLIVTSAHRAIPLILINGRLSERSFRRWRWAPHSIAMLLRCFDLCLAQSAAHAARYRDLGAPRVSTTGNLKLDVPEPPADANALTRLRSAIAERTVIAGASTHAGEETALIDAHRRLRNSFPGLLTIIAPRHPERGRGIVEIARAAELRPRLRSLGELPDADTDIYIADTMGELGLIYRVAPIVFVGGSLASHGGQNPIEPIKLGAAILHGPHVWNFAEIYAALDQAHGAEQVTDVGKLAVRVGAWLKDADERSAIVSSARTTVATLGGGLDRTLAAIEPYLMQVRLEHRHHDA